MEKINTTKELCDFILKEFAECRSNIAKEQTEAERVGYSEMAHRMSAKYDQTAYLYNVVKRIKEERI